MSDTSAPVLGGGLWYWVWLARGNCDPARVAAECAAIGAAGVIVHEVGTAAPQLRWIERARPALGGLVCVAVGSRGPAKWERHMAVPLVDILRAGHRAMTDCEGAWDPRPAGEQGARRLVDHVLARVPDARGRTADCAWWKPSVHSGFPIRTFGELCGTRYPQCYPGVSRASGLQTDGAAARCLTTARVQYPPRGTPARAVYATVRGYARSARDACKLALDEPHQLVYLGSRRDTPNALTPQVRRGLEAAKRVRDAGGVRAWQGANGLVVDGIVGPKTLASLGL